MALAAAVAVVFVIPAAFIIIAEAFVVRCYGTLGQSFLTAAAVDWVGCLSRSG